MMTELRATERAGSHESGGHPALERHAEPCGYPALEERREHVVRRLLAAGLSVQTLLTLLPDFRPVVQRVRPRD